jgi:hypothetical protein
VNSHPSDPSPREQHVSSSDSSAGKHFLRSVAGPLIELFKPVLGAAQSLPPLLKFAVIFTVLVASSAVVFAWTAVESGWPWALLTGIIGGVFLIAGLGIWNRRQISGSGTLATPAKELLRASSSAPTAAGSRLARQSPLSPDELRTRYLRMLWAQCALVKTTTFKSTTGQEIPELELSAIYTDLDVIEPTPDRTRSPVEGDLTSEARQRRSALAAISDHPKLVLLGDPGSGKTTLVDFVSLCLAGEWLGRSDANHKRLGEAFALPRLLPVRVVLRDYAARGLPKDQGLWAFLAEELAREQTAEGGTLEACTQIIHRALQQREGALLLLDGIDEVPDAAGRRQQLKRVVETFARDFPHCRILATSRPYAYQNSSERFPGFVERSLADFSLDQIKGFIERWYTHLGQKEARLGADKAAAYAEGLKNEVERRERLRDLAGNPLLAALMAWLHRQREGGALPERRQALYEEAVKHLLDLWQRDKPLYDEQGRLKGTEQTYIPNSASPRMHCARYSIRWRMRPIGISPR